jgi:hypothetical protein
MKTDKDIRKLNKEELEIVTGGVYSEGNDRYNDCNDPNVIKTTINTDVFGSNTRGPR